MKNRPLMAALKAELIAAFDASALSMYQIAKAADIQPSNVERLLDPDTGAQVDTLDRAFRALGKRIEIRIVALLLALLPLVALADAPPRVPRPCTVVAHVVIHTYTGPIEIDQLCMTLSQYVGPPGPINRLDIEGTDMADGIFRDGFDSP